MKDTERFYSNCYPDLMVGVHIAIYHLKKGNPTEALTALELAREKVDKLWENSKSQTRDTRC